MAVNCPVQIAWNYGNLDEHDGAGFFLVLKMRDGSIARGAAYAPDNGVIHLESNIEGIPPLFIRCADVMTATVEW